MNYCSRCAELEQENRSLKSAISTLRTVGEEFRLRAHKAEAELAATTKFLAEIRSSLG